MIESSTIPRPEPQLLRHWNTILAKSGLSVWEGATDHHQVYSHADDLDLLMMSNRAARKTRSLDGHIKGYSFVPIGKSGSSDRGLYLQMALQALSSDERSLLQHYQDKTAVEIANIYETTTESIKCRIKRLRKKLKRTANGLANRPF